MAESPVQVGSIIAGLYKLKKKIGSGGFGDVYLGQLVTDPRQEVAIKFEKKNVHPSQLDHEHQVYMTLQDCTRIPRMQMYENHGASQFLAMERLGKSLGQVIDKRGSLSLEEVLRRARQLVRALEQVHSRGFVHGDVMPDNIVKGMRNRRKSLLLIDFGLTTKYLDPSGVHIPYSDNRSTAGCLAFMSTNVLFGVAPSRRDDLESLAYVLIYLIRGSLPWQSGLSPAGSLTFEEELAIVRTKRLATSVEDFLEGLPVPIVDFLHYCRGLGFDEQPDYRNLLKLFTTNRSARHGKADLDVGRKPARGQKRKAPE